MKRRRFLRFAGLGIAGLPAWMASCSKSQQLEVTQSSRMRPIPFEDGSEEAVVDAALLRARNLGKPLLVFVIPDQDKLWERQTIFGEYLNYGETPVLAELALCEVVCATTSQLAEHVDVPDEHVGALALLVETGGKGLEVRSIADDLPPVADAGFGAAADQAYERSVLQRIDVLAARIHGLVAADHKMLAARAERAREQLADDDLAALERMAASGSGADLALADKGAAVLRLAATEPGPSSAALLETLAAAARARLKAKPPAGAKWASSTGCGFDVEGDSDGLMVACGMGHVPEISRRFLYFYTAYNST